MKRRVLGPRTDVPDIVVPPTPKPQHEPELECPICGLKVLSMHQLNRHLDDEHANASEEVPGTLTGENVEDLTGWLRKKVVSQTSKLPIGLPSKLVKLDSLTSPEYPSLLATSPSPQPDTRGPKVTRKHWRNPSGNDFCHFPRCRKLLNVRNGSVNCRRCGELFCNEHTAFRMKLDSLAEYSPVDGTWCRCCESCFNSKPGYLDTDGATRDLFTQFQTSRQRIVDQQGLKTNQLENRLVKLVARFNEIDLKDEGRVFKFFASSSLGQKRAAEREVVAWASDASATHCHLCFKMFGVYVRKHHCRLCGKLVCGDEMTACSKEVPLGKLCERLGGVQARDPQYVIRVCLGCKDGLLKRRNFIREVEKSELPEYLQIYHDLTTYEKVIIILLKKFQASLVLVQGEPLDSTIIAANKSRGKLVESLQAYEKLAKSLKVAVPEGSDDTKIRHSILQHATWFFQENGGKFKRYWLEMAEVKPDLPAPKLTKKQIREAREELMVYREQMFLIGEMIDTAKKQRRFDEIPPLLDNLRDLEAMCGDIEAKLGEDGF
ncbi:hypothetical protein BABINDRAFT_161128 [Babjeviella inositovora NRRL Y-12698]|uniref:FYVE-type domain-containing protein n=1 Tax=Babjeviella inositovora NRRL Y-12698 TaxID=984486 RepID=A0A1E3QR36_9ASCO|nr:uncharacterized protein BABINDRAFT_161128 [Babjeviella inositovora NRRL Y-12698]ODQ80149.1 hypothetical protein BABINDRAFT_161128 [Babjeviella inositovora NRRL Y-12698]